MTVESTPHEVEFDEDEMNVTARKRICKVCGMPETSWLHDIEEGNK